MATKLSSSAALFLALNLVLCNLAFSTNNNPPPNKSCSTLDLSVCADVLGLIQAGVNVPKDHKCCSLIGNLVNLDAGVCLCAAVQANLLNLVDLDIPFNVFVLLNKCGCDIPRGFKC